MTTDQSLDFPPCLAVPTNQAPSFSVRSFVPLHSNSHPDPLPIYHRWHQHLFPRTRHLARPSKRHPSRLGASPGIPILSALLTLYTAPSHRRQVFRDTSHNVSPSSVSVTPGPFSSTQLSRRTISGGVGPTRCRIPPGQPHCSRYVSNRMGRYPSEYSQAAVASAFDPPPGKPPFSYVFDLTGEVNHDRGEVVCRLSVPLTVDYIAPQIAIKLTFTVARIIALEAAKRNVTTYVRLQQPVYESSDKGTHDEKEDVKPVRPLDVWWHETLRMLASIQG